MFLKKGGGVKKKGQLIHLSGLCLSNKKAYRFDKSIRSFIQTSREQDPDKHVEKLIKPISYIRCSL